MAQVVDITQILVNAQSPDARVRNQAEEQLQQFSDQNYAAYLFTLASEIANKEKPLEARQIAGIILKNALDAADEAKKAEKAQKWLSLDTSVKQQIKQALLSTLPSDVGVARHTAALVIGKVAAIELPAKQWNELISTLLNNMSQQPPNSGLKQSTLEALGYVCEEMGELKDDVLGQEEVNSVLTAVVQGMRADETDSTVRLAATQALFNALEFAHNNFENDNERNYLMQVVCEGTMSPEKSVREASYECLVKIAANYYNKLPAYITDIFTLTSRAAREDDEDVAKQAIEFWCTLCEEEQDIQEQLEGGDTDSDAVNHNFVLQALRPLVQVLLELLVRQEEGQDKDDANWNVSMAAGTCLELVALTVTDDIVPLVMPFVQANISKNSAPEDWRFRDAATFAFGAILEGPDPDKLTFMVGSGLEFLLSAMKDPNSQVRHTTAWTIGRIFEFLHGPDVQPSIITQANLPGIVSVLLGSIRDEHHIVEKVCYALSKLAAGFRDTDGTTVLSPHFKEIVQALLETAAMATDSQEASRNLQTQAFEAINEVVRSASSDTLLLVAALIPLMLGKLGETLQVQAVAENRERTSELQGLLCGVLQVIIQKLSETEPSKTAVLQSADAVMEALLAVFRSNVGTVHEEAMLAVGALTYACGRHFAKYMDSLFPVLQMGLTNHKEWQVCQATVGVLGDICRAIEEQIFGYCNAIMEILLNNLQSNDVHRLVKPQILSSFGDIALAIGDKFEYYLNPVLMMLQSAQGLSVGAQQSGDEETIDYNNQLRQGIFEAYSGIFNGLSKEKVDTYLAPYAQGMLEFGEFVYNDKTNRDDVVSKSAVALLGDVAATVTGAGALFGQRTYWRPFIEECRQTEDPSLSQAANWALSAIARASGVADVRSHATATSA